MMPNTNYNLFNGTSETLALAGAVFYGKSKNGTIYIYTKNGWNEAPRIMKLKDLENNSYYDYGTVRGLNSKSGFYNKK